jgi:hypothetical protein
MKEIVSLLLTTSCLAIAGLGIYFFSYNSNENSVDTQKAGKKRTSISGKKQIEVTHTYDENDDDNDYHDDDYDNSDYNNDYDNDDNITKNDYKYKTKSKSKVNNNKTKKNTNRYSSSKKNYYY